MKVFLGPCEIAGYYSNLSRGMRSIGVCCDFVNYFPHPFGYGGDNAPTFIRWVHGVHKIFGFGSKSSCARAVIALTGILCQFFYFPIAIFRYNVFVFGFGKSLLPNNIDLPLLRILRKKVFLNLAHGSELRPPYIDGTLQSSDGEKQPSSKKLRLVASKYCCRIRFFEKNSSAIIGAPFSTSQFSINPQINFFALGIPYIQMEHDDASGDSLGMVYQCAASLVGDNKFIRILHCPSHPAAKGSLKIRAAIEGLRGKGFEIDFIELINRPNSDVIAEIKRCDFVVDQLYSDTPMAGFATEAAWFGKPAVVGGYGFDSLREFVPKGMWPPSKICHPNEIEQAIEDMIVNTKARRLLGEAAQNFVRQRWSATEVARRYIRLIEGNTPAEWRLNPEDVVYLQGCGQPEEITKKNIKALVETYGVEALQLSHRPSLEKAFVEFAGAAR